MCDSVVVIVAVGLLLRLFVCVKQALCGAVAPRELVMRESTCSCAQHFNEVVQSVCKKYARAGFVPITCSCAHKLPVCVAHKSTSRCSEYTKNDMCQESMLNGPCELYSLFLWQGRRRRATSRSVGIDICKVISVSGHSDEIDIILFILYYLREAWLTSASYGISCIFPAAKTEMHNGKEQLFRSFRPAHLIMYLSSSIAWDVV